MILDEMRYHGRQADEFDLVIRRDINGNSRVKLNLDSGKLHSIYVYPMNEPFCTHDFVRVIFFNGSRIRHYRYEKSNLLYTGGLQLDSSEYYITMDGTRVKFIRNVI